MSDAVLNEKLAVIATIREGITMAMKNTGPILVNVLLWILTIWIPYLNVGTTIGLGVGIVSKVSRGEIIPMFEIFDPKYRKYMGEFFLTSGLVGLGIGIGLCFGIIPGIVICLAWSMALLLAIDKGKNPSEAISLSNNCTYGYKWKMLGIYFLIGLANFIVTLILMSIGRAIHTVGIMFFMTLLSFAASIFTGFLLIGVKSSIYRQLTDKI
ncbi:MAG: hypothetical protein FWF29_00210 [Treponema sp.]|nr:hypothetical protein [Treponema sp.]